MRRALAVVITAMLLTLVSPPAVNAAPANGTRTGAGVRISGDVATPATLTAAQIAAFPTTTLPLTTFRGTRGAVTGALLTDVLDSTGPQFGGGKNPKLHALVTVTGQGGWRINLAYGELDPGFGNHPALLTTTGNVVSLVVPGDTTRLRSVPRVTSITLTSLPATPVTEPPAGGVTVIRGHRSITLTAATLNRLPQQERTVTFQSGSGAQTHTEKGPALTAVLLTAGVPPLPNTVVTAIGSDGYAATATNGEALLGGRPLLLSLAEDGTTLPQPRLVVDGDIKGGRYVSDVVTLTIT